MKIDLKKLKKLVWFGKLNEIEIKTLSQKQINYLLFFAYKNNKMQSIDLLLPHLNRLQFNQGKNILHCIIDKFFLPEVYVLESLKSKVTIENKILFIYKSSIEYIAVNDPSQKNSVLTWTVFLNDKLKENLSKRLESNLISHGSVDKLLKI